MGIKESAGQIAEQDQEIEWDDFEEKERKDHKFS